MGKNYGKILWAYKWEKYIYIYIYIYIYFFSIGKSQVPYRISTIFGSKVQESDKKKINRNKNKLKNGLKDKHKNENENKIWVIGALWVIKKGKR